MKPPCQIEESGWFEWGMDANCQAQVPHIVALGFVTLLFGGLALLYWLSMGDE